MAMTTRREAVAIGLAAAAFGKAGAEPAARKPLVIGHRGASALRPEHTLGSYLKAIEDGADWIEPDLCCTRDGVLVARHENNIAATTDVARHAEFAGRKTEKLVDGRRESGWFVEDFTLAELKTLRAVERLPQIRPASAAFDGRWQVMTWPEIIDFTAREAQRRGRTIGLVPELKHSTYFAAIGLPLEDRFVQAMRAHAYLRRASIGIQSFEVANLRLLRRRLGWPGNVRLMQLVEPSAGIPADVAAAGGTLSYAAMMTPAGLAEVAQYADIVSPPTRAVIPLGPDGRLGTPAALVADAHRVGLQVISWTFRPENQFLAADFRGPSGDAARNPEGSIREIRAYLAAGLDGFFTDDPALGRAAVDGIARQVQ